MPTPAATDQRRSDPAHDESDSDSDVRPTQRRLTSGDKRKPGSRQARLDFSNARHPDTFSSPIRLSSPAKTQSSGKSAGMFGKARSGVIDVSSDDDSDQNLPSPSALVPQQRGDDAPEVRGRKRRTRSTAKTTATDSASEDDNITVLAAPRSAVALESEDDDDDDMPTTMGTQRRKRARRASPDSFIASSPPRVIDSDDDLEIVDRPRKRRRQAEQSSNEEDEESVTPARQRGKMRRKLSQREQEELENELDGLGPSSDVEASARKSRNDQAAKKSVKQQALEKLKRMRSGQAKGTSQIQEEDDAAEPQPGSDASSQGNESYSEEEEDVHVRPVRSSQMFEEDEDDANFIDSEDEPGNPLGIPDGLPLEYSRYASKKPKELFPHAVEWMVQKKINPAFQMNDAIYDLTFRKLDDEVTGLAGSKFKSSVWTSDFTMSLNSRPTIAFASIDRNEGANWMRDHCDACNRSNHPATFQIQFQGRPYYRKSLEDVAEDDSDDDDDDDDSEDDSNSRSEDPDKPSHDEQGRQVPPPSKTYYVGKFCMSNAHTAHSLHHWRYHLNEWVIEWLTRNGYNNPDEVVKRDAWSTKKRRKFANKITDRMEKEGVIKQLYRDYRKNIDEARNSKQGRYGD